MAFWSTCRTLVRESVHMTPRLVLPLRSSRSLGTAAPADLTPVKRGSAYRFMASRAADPQPSSSGKVDVKYILVHGTPSSPIPLQNVVGWHSSEIKYNEEKEEVEINPHYFKENPVFADLLHQVIADHFAESPELKKKARETNSGWLSIIDTRSRYGRAVPSEDIFGAVLLDDGAMERGSYKPMPTHRIFTDEGIFMLDSYLDEKLSEAIANFKGRAAKK